MKDRFEKIISLMILAVPLAFVLKGGYLQQVSGYLYLFIIQGYVAWFLFFKCGQPFFGYAVTMAIGAYGTIVPSIGAERYLLLSMLLSALAAAVVSVVIFVATSRARGFYVSMASFLLAILFPKLIEAMQNTTGGRSGLYFSGLSGPLGTRNLYLLVIVLTVAVVAFFFWIMDTRTGKVFTLISENDRLTQSVGINTFGYKMVAYAIARFHLGPRRRTVRKLYRLHLFRRPRCFHYHVHFLHSPHRRQQSILRADPGGPFCHSGSGASGSGGTVHEDLLRVDFHPCCRTPARWPCPRDPETSWKIQTTRKMKFAFLRCILKNWRTVCRR